MVIYTFASSKKPGLFAFAADQSGRQLPDKHGPWKLTGRVNPDAALPHDLDRATSRRLSVKLTFTNVAPKKEFLMAVGTVKFFNVNKGFGFISPDGGGQDVFVHITAVERSGMGSLREGQKVNFDAETDRRSGKTAATNLRPASSS